MTILLIQLPTSHLGSNEIVYPVGLSRLSSVLKTRGAYFTAMDLNLYKDPWDTFKQALINTRPSAVGLSFRNLDPLGNNLTSYLSSLEIGAKLTKSLSNALLIVGGPAFSLMPRQFMEKFLEIDIGIVGEGELALAKLVESQWNPMGVPNVIYRSGDKLLLNRSGPHISMKEIPSLDLTNLSPLGYLGHNSYVAPMGIEGKRGCDLNCGYCVYPRIGGFRVRVRSPNLIVDEMELLNKEYGINLFHFTDPVLNKPTEHFEEIVREILKRRLKVGWTGFFREDHVSESQIEMAKEAGLVTIYFSADGAYSKALKLLNKHLTSELLTRAYTFAARSKILTVYHFFLDLPFETEEDREEMKNFIYKLVELHYPNKNLGGIVFSRIRLYPNTPLTTFLIRKNLVPSHINFLYPYYFSNHDNSYLMYELDSFTKQMSIFSLMGIDGVRNENLSP